jgi:hypothetical protein
MTTMIPNSILKEAQHLQRSFIWGDSSAGRKYHAISWNMLTQPKSMGGLGLRRMEVRNRACLMKMGWELQQGSDDLWTKVIHGKYGRGVDSLTDAIAKPLDSKFWKALMSFMPWIIGQSHMAVGNDRSTNAWDTCWSAPGIRIEDFEIDIPLEMRNAKVVDLVTREGCWNWDRLSWLPNDILNMLITIPPPEDDLGEDVRLWPQGKNGNFSVASAYDLLTHSEASTNTTNGNWHMIWKMQVPERVKSFIWVLKHGRLLTNFWKSKMSLGSPSCCYCGDITETELHVLRDCPKCMHVWLNIVSDSTRDVFFSSNLQQCITLNMTGGIEGIEVDNWVSYWALACHALWYCRTGVIKKFTMRIILGLAV